MLASGIFRLTGHGAMTEQVSTRSSRNRRVVALMGWGCLVITAFFLWNARQTGSIRAVTDEPVAFILAAFAAFVGVFAWMLYNPGRSSAAESPSLFFAAIATLFPPSIIGFCLMPMESPLRWWLALGLFLLCVIAVLSHVPDEFFGVPRARSSYLTPIPAFDRVEGTVLDPNAAWFKLEDLSRVVLDTQRPSLAPRSYLQRGEATTRVAPATRAEVRPLSSVDDILGTDFDLGLLDEESKFDDRPSHSYTQQQAAERSDASRFHADDITQRQQTVPLRERFRRKVSRKGGRVYETLNPESGHLRASQRLRREVAREQSIGRSSDRRVRHAATMRIDSRRGRGAASAFEAGNSARTAQRAAESVTAHRQRQSYMQNDSASHNRTERTELPTGEESSRYRRTTESNVKSRKSQHLQEAEQRRLQAEQEPTTRRRGDRYREQQTEETTTSRESQYRRDRQQQRESTDRAERVARVDRKKREGDSVRRESSTSHSSSNFSALPIPVPLPPTEPVQGFLEESSATPQQLFGQTIERESKTTDRRKDTVRSDSQQTPRRSRYDEETRRETEDTRNENRTASEVRSTAQTAPVERAPSTAPRSQRQQTFERVKDADGSELVEGVVPIHFDTGQKRANVHIPFSPPLPGMPEVECECVDGENLRLKVPVQQSYGIRIEARRSNADEPLDAEIGFSAVYTGE